jgi:hypothetical protein
VFSLLLLAAYGPAVLVLRWRGLELLELLELLERAPGGAATPPDKRHEWLRDHGLAGTLGQQAWRLAAVLGPLITGGPVADLLEMVVG